MRIPKTVIVKYNAGNVRSVIHALERLGVRAVVSDIPGEIAAADQVIFPGVGEASSAMAYLRERGLDRVIAGLRQPVLGICLGLQLMCSSSEEGDTECLGIFPGRVRRFASDTLRACSDFAAERISGSGREIFAHADRGVECPTASKVSVKGTGAEPEKPEVANFKQVLKIPQMGWNDIYGLRSPLFAGLDEGSFVYFVHGYYAERGEQTIATADYTLPYSAALQKDNFYAVQFHPEKSGAVGERILHNFIFNV